MEDKQLIKEMYSFCIELALDLKPDVFDKHRTKWNDVMDKCEQKLNMK